MMDATQRLGDHFARIDRHWWIYVPMIAFFAHLNLAISSSSADSWPHSPPVYSVSLPAGVAGAFFNFFNVVVILLAAQHPLRPASRGDVYDADPSSSRLDVKRVGKVFASIAHSILASADIYTAALAGGFAWIRFAAVTSSLILVVYVIMLILSLWLPDGLAEDRKGEFTELPQDPLPEYEV